MRRSHLIIFCHGFGKRRRTLCRHEFNDFIFGNAIAVKRVLPEDFFRRFYAVETAVALIKQHGYNQVTVSQICREAGIAKGSFYVHYDAKEDIVRESYYSDMNDYIHAHYTQYLQQNPTASATQKIIAFLGLELAFAEYTGYELTCLAFAVNLSACLPGPSPHFTKRRFTEAINLSKCS